jgi:diguanylate cyclase (GGDEF)-like protein/PAS domain S-box-containing protein
MIQDVTDRAEAFRQVEHREQQLQTIFQQAMVGILHADPEGRILLINDCYCEILGRSRDEILGLTLAEVTPPGEPAEQCRFNQGDAAAGAPFQAQKRYVRPDGSSVWCEIAVSFVPSDGGGRSSIVTAKDVTAYVAVDDELRTSRALLQTVVDSMSDLIFIKDRDRRFVLANKALSEGCGVVAGLRTCDVFDASLCAAYDSVDAEVMAAGEPRVVEEIVPVRGEERRFRTVKFPWPVDGVISGVIGVSRDLTRRDGGATALHGSEALIRSIVEASGDCINLLSLDGRILFVNAAGLRVMELADPAKMIGLDWVQLWPDETRRQAREALEKAQRGMTAQFSAPGKTARGIARSWDVVISPVPDEQNQPAQLVVIARDNTDQQQFVDELTWTATHDPLTGLPNRVLFHSHLSAACEGGGPADSFAVLHLDLDHFKEVNDAYGHAAGDSLLKQFAERLKPCFQATGTVARLGGDEFAIILHSCSEIDAERIGAKLIEQLRTPFEHDGYVLDCKTSIGIGVYPTHGTTPDALLRSADLALYSAKGSGRSTSRLYNGTMGNEEQKRTSMLALGRDALARDAILPFYQPKINLRNGTLVGFEALLRWCHPRTGVRPPAELAPCFEHIEIGSELTKRMLAGITLDMRDWLDRGLDFGSVAMNASSADFHDGDFADRLLDTLHQRGIPTRHFQLEVTESVFLGRGAEKVGEALTLLSAEGVEIALDDFGTGYASLRHLRLFPVSGIKIDRSFVQDLDVSADATEIIRAVINLAQSLRMHVVAEGVETAAQADRLAFMGCDQGQGFLYSRAVPGSDVAGLLKSLRHGG